MCNRRLDADANQTIGIDTAPSESLERNIEGVKGVLGKHRYALNGEEVARIPFHSGNSQPRRSVDHGGILESGFARRYPVTFTDLMTATDKNGVHSSPSLGTLFSWRFS